MKTVEDILKPFFDQRVDEITKGIDDLLKRHTDERGMIDIDAALNEKGPEGPDSEQ